MSLPFTKQRPIVCVQGLGFVGLAMSTVLAKAANSQGEPQFNVIGIDLPKREELYATINSGKMPFASEDPNFAPELESAVKVQKNLFTTGDISYYEMAEVVVVDVHLSITKEDDKDYSKYLLHDGPFKKAIQTLGQRIRPTCLVLVETTVPPGFCETVVKPSLTEEFRKRGIETEPLVAHSYERVMPGRNYLSSIRTFPRTYSACSMEAQRRAKEFLECFIDTKKFPLRVESAPVATELAKVMENSFRAMNIAFIQEWTLLAEKMGVNLFSVIDGIRNRPTHANIMKPGFGVGGYCLTKDSLLAKWSHDNLYPTNYSLPFSLQALKVNDEMPLHAVELIEAKMSLQNKKVAVLGYSYREDVGDTRFSPSEVFCREVMKRGGSVWAHDPYLTHWEELPEVKILTSIDKAALNEMDVIVLAVRHDQYMHMEATQWEALTKTSILIVDGFDILNDDKIKHLLKSGRNVIGIGKGHISKMEKNV